MKDPQTGAEALRARFVALLADYGVDVEPEDELLVISGEADAGPCPGIIECRDLEIGEAVKAEQSLVLVEATYTLPFDPVPPDRLAEVALVVACINPGVGVGHFELDPLTRLLGFRTAQLVDPEAVTDGLLMAPLLEGLNVIDDHAGSLSAVLDGAAAGHVFAEVVLGEYGSDAWGVGDDPDEDDALPPMSDQMRAAIMGWMERASATYRAAGETARHQALAALVRRAFTD